MNLSNSIHKMQW